MTATDDRIADAETMSRQIGRTSRPAKRFVTGQQDCPLHRVGRQLSRCECPFAQAQDGEWSSSTASLLQRIAPAWHVCFQELPWLGVRWNRSLWIFQIDHFSYHRSRQCPADVILGDGDRGWI